MINISRSEEVPPSLLTVEIKNYLKAYQDYINTPEECPEPKKTDSYRNSDLLEAFDRDFHSKCYLTEEKYTNSWVMDVDHFIPRNERQELTHEWANLFPASHYTNLIKPKTTPEGGYLNPCVDDVEKEILYSLSMLGDDPKFDPKDHTNTKAINSCKLLARVHNGHDKNTEKGTASLRHAIRKKYNEILLKIIDYLKAKEGTQEKHQCRRDLQDLLSKKSSFTMLSRSIPALSFIEEKLFD
jgi:hypothetical protein